MREENSDYPSPRSPLQEFFDAQDQRRKSEENSKIEDTLQSLQLDCNSAQPESHILSKEVQRSPEKTTGSPSKSPRSRISPRERIEDNSHLQDHENDVFLRPLPIERLSVRVFILPFFQIEILGKKPEQQPFSSN
jgi:hypothetical protein